MKRSLKALFTLALTLALGLTLGSASLASAVENTQPEGDYMGYLVMLRPTSQQGEDGLLARRVEEVPESLTLLSERDAIYAAPSLDSIRDLVYAGRVALAEPDYQAELLDTVVVNPNDSYFTQSNYQYNLKNTHVQAAWDAGLSGNGVTVAVIDSGLKASHIDAPVKQAVGRYYYFREPTSADTNMEQFVHTLKDSNGNLITDEKGNVIYYGYFSSNVTEDNSGHGTAVSGVIAAKTNNGRGIAGIAPNVTILPIRCFTSTPGHKGGYSSNLISGLNYAVSQGADIINMSFGLKSNSEIFHAAINSAANAGCILVASAGNDGNPVPNYPAAYPNVISVGATDRQNKVADFSQRNDTVHVFAPGVSIYTLGYTSDSAFASSNGTSFSAPTVVGVAALLMEANPQLTHSEFAQLLAECSDDVTAIDTSSGATTEYTSAGLLNVQKLLDRMGAATANITASADGLTVQASFHPAQSSGLTDSDCLLLAAAYNSQGHLIESAGVQAQRSSYGGYQLLTTFHQPDVAVVRAYLLRADGTLSACLPPVERSVGQ